MRSTANPPHLTVGGLDIPWTTTFGVTIRSGYRSPQYHVAWSPDGKRFACVQRNTPNPGVTVLVNGKPMGPTYQNANELVWSPDGSKLAYTGTSPTPETSIDADTDPSRRDSAAFNQVLRE